MMPQAGEIQAIDRGSVHRICSGQVVLNLATAIKELVENSLDAGANNIEVKLKEYGSESIEVIDNGSGVKEENFEGLTLKHHTSKLRDFDDLTSVDTFGFRGEALSSLCALSKMTITTCHESSATGMKLQFDHQGHIVNKTAFARQPGTTVLIQQVFSTLPVRHKEFLRNLKKEFHKMVHVLNGYCLISTKVKVTCTNQTNKGHKSTVLATSGGANIRENITNIFGPKQVHSLMEFCQVDPDQHLCEDFNIKPLEERKNPFRIEGYVSSCEHGQGRSTNDRQFIFINKRPCDHTKVCRLINDVYHSYNRHQNPFVILNITLASESVDVNVTPDKRQIFMEEEKLLLATLKASLLKMYESTPSTYRMMEVQPKLSFLSSPSPNEDCNRPVKICSDVGSTQKPVLTGLANLKRSFSSSFAKNTTADEEKDTNQKSKQRKLDTFIKASHSSPRQHSPAKSTASLWKKSQSSASENNSNRTGETIILTGQASFQKENNDYSSQSVETNCNNSNIRPCNPKSNLGSNLVSSDNNKQKGSDFGSQKSLSDVSDTPPPDSVSCDSATELSSSQTSSQSQCRSPDSGVLCAGEETGTALSSASSMSATCSEVKDSAHTVEEHEMTVYDEAGSSDDVKVKTVPFSMKNLIKKSSCQNQPGDGGSDSRYCRAFRAKIAPKDNKSAEEELQKEISKDMFPKMEVIGQFNLGFILARLGKDLFIVDQHATDEKYNFEMLQQHTVIQSQKLIQPQNLELTAANESILLDNLEVFHKNGFDFEIDMTAPSTQRVRLTTMPVSKGWTFEKADIEELIFMLSDSPGIMCRPSRIRQMFASRACRKSIMVGTALNQQEMKKVLNHMAELDQPWNCPHGRPTMRHLINLDMVADTPDQE